MSCDSSGARLRSAPGGDQDTRGLEGVGLLRQDVLHADETPVAMLEPGHGKTHRAYLWSYGTTAFESGAGLQNDCRIAGSRWPRSSRAVAGRIANPSG
ncbi:hypothetical protein CKO44_24165 [Rubrivivax gelatinosus]|nr:hypothetical protein [Rubrivivax gelatinosus]